MANRRFIDPENPPFPNHFRAWREHRGLTQAQVEAKYGWPAARVSNLENGRASITGHVLMALARAYRCTVADLVGRDPGEVPVTADGMVGAGFVAALHELRVQLAKLEIKAEELHADVLPRIKALEKGITDAGGQVNEALAEAGRLAETFERALGTLRGEGMAPADGSAPDAVND